MLISKSELDLAAQFKGFSDGRLRGLWGNEFHLPGHSPARDGSVQPLWTSLDDAHEAQAL